MAHMGGTASEEIDAPLDEVGAVGEDVLSAPDWQDGRVAMTALETDDEGRATLVEAENDIKVRPLRSQVRFRYEAPDRLSWRMVKGDLKSVEGLSNLEDVGGGLTRSGFRFYGIIDSM